MLNAELFYQIYEKTGDFGKSLMHYKSFKTLEDSIYNKDFHRKISDLQIKYEVEQKEKDRQRIQQAYEEKQAEENKQWAYLFLIMVLLIVVGFFVV